MKERAEQIDNWFYVISWIIVGGFVLLSVLELTGIFDPVEDIFYPCSFRFATGFYCPGCGGTHAVSELARGHVIASFMAHPFVIYVMVCALVNVVYNTVARVRNKRIIAFRMLYVYIGLGVLFIQWIVKNLVVVFS